VNDIRRERNRARRGLPKRKRPVTTRRRMRDGTHRGPSASLSATRPDLALLVYDLRGSGVVRNVLRIARAASNAGLATEIWVVSASGAMAETVPPGVKLRVLGSVGERLGRTPGSALAVRRMAAAIRVWRPRLLFSAGNQIHAFATSAWRLAGAPRDTRFMGRASNAVIGRTRDWRAAARPFERYQYGSMARIVAVAPELAADLTEHLGIEPKRVVTIPNGVVLPALDQDRPLPHPWLAPGEPPLVIGMGRLARQKNFALLIDALAIVRRSHVARLAILGEGAEHAKLAAQAARLGIARDVLLPGFVADPVAWLMRSPLFVLSSRWEGNSNALLEALACGCAVVATDIPSGPGSVLGGGEFGALVPPDNAAALAAAIATALDHPPPRERQRGRAAQFSADAAMEAYLALFREELARLSD
jgi:glycosyltransferase involved in cell wall biosynthesis